VPPPASEEIALEFVNMADISNENVPTKIKYKKKVSWSLEEEEEMVITEWQIVDKIF
jgi:hypothetical protein